MRDPRTLRRPFRWRLTPLRIAAIYAVLGALWILFSDQLLAALVGEEDPAALTRLQTVKGWFYVLVTAGLLYELIRRHTVAIGRSEEALRATLEGMPDAVLIIDPEERVVDVNRAALELAGVDRKEEALGPLPELYRRFRLRYPDGHSIPPQEGVIARALMGETISGREVILRRSDGQDVFVSVSASPVMDPARRGIAMAVAVLRDMTELRRLERLRDEFLSTATHELKTPVTTIKGYSQMMRKWMRDGHDPREERALEVINAQCDRINRRLQEMLEVVRFRTAPPELHRTRFDLGDLAAQVVHQVKDSTPSHRLLLTREGPTPVEADRERLEEVVRTLLDNAVKYSPSGGDIEVRVRTWGADAVLSVKDQGVGIPRERQPYVFEPFYEAVPPGAPGYRGVVPLSLYLSKLTIEHHKGHIWFESEADKGSTFYISLPLAPTEERARQGASDGRSA